MLYITLRFLEQIWLKILNYKSGLAEGFWPYMVNAILYHLMKQHSMLIIWTNHQSKTWAIYMKEFIIPLSWQKETFYCLHKARSVWKWGQILQKRFEDCNGVTCSLGSYWQLITIEKPTLSWPRLVVASWIWQYPWMTASQSSRELFKL